MPQKRKIGQPTKFRSAYVQEAERVCEQEGYTDKQLARHFNVSVGTINNWKRSYPEFAVALRKGKSRFDTEVVENQLLKKIMSWEYEEKHYERNDQGHSVLTKVVTKVKPPDTLAMIFWLKNRNPARWGDRHQIAHPGDVIVNVVNYASVQTNQESEVDGNPVALLTQAGVDETPD